jgi:hypothetical protein
MLLRYFLNDFEMVPVVHNISDITFVATLHVGCISVFSYFQISSPSFSIAYLSPHIALAINRQAPLFITDYDVRFVARNGFVSFHLLILEYGYVTAMTYFY